jgi:hypothetical protein
MGGSFSISFKTKNKVVHREIALFIYFQLLDLLFVFERRRNLDNKKLNCWERAVKNAKYGII